MQALTPEQIKRAMVNGSRGEVAAMTLPPGLADLEWEHLEFLGWRAGLHALPDRPVGRQHLPVHHEARRPGRPQGLDTFLDAALSS